MATVNRRKRLLFALALLATTALPRFAAANNCTDGGSLLPDGIGGAGVRPAAPADGGIGGTAAIPDRPEEGGVGGTATHPSGPGTEGGIGGTGTAPHGPDDEGGIGGTGIASAADTGVIGTISGFASICVGGREIHYSATTPVEVDGKPGSQADLGVGQVVEVVASGRGDEVNALRIALQHVVSGPIAGIDTGQDRITVLGQTVQLTNTTRAGIRREDRGMSADSLRVGESVRVSGMRRADGVIVASRIAPDTSGDLVRLSGAVTVDAEGNLEVAGVAVRNNAARAPVAGTEVRVTGGWNGRAITAASIEPIPSLPFGGNVAEVDIEGFVSGPAGGGQVRVGPYTVSVDAGDGKALSTAATLPVRLHAVVRDRHAIADRITALGDFRPPQLPPPGLPADTKAGSDAPRADRPPAGAVPDNRPREDAPPRPDVPPLSGDMRPPLVERPVPPPRPDRPALPPALPERPNVPDRPSIPALPERPPGRPDLPQHRGRP